MPDLPFGANLNGDAIATPSDPGMVWPSYLASAGLGSQVSRWLWWEARDNLALLSVLENTLVCCVLLLQVKHRRIDFGLDEVLDLIACCGSLHIFNILLRVGGYDFKRVQWYAPEASNVQFKFVR